MNTEAIFNRIFFCEKCFFAGGPNLRDDVIIFSESEEMFLLYKFQQIIKEIKTLPRGFTPHLVQFTSYHHGETPLIKYQMLCGVCGVDEINKKIPNKSECEFVSWREYETNANHWQEIINNKI